MTALSKLKGFAKNRAYWLIPIAVIVLLMSPMIFTGRSFHLDWLGHLWYLSYQYAGIDQDGIPDIFINSDPFGLFYPHYLFYGGTLYVIGAYIAVIMGGNPTAAYISLYAFGFVMAYGGMTWLSQLAGLIGWRSQLAGLAYVTSAYILTLIYARGGFGEFAATSAIPLVLASFVSLVRAKQLRPLPVVAFLTGIVFLTGSHNITLIWGSLFVILGIVAITVAIPRETLRKFIGDKIRLASIVGIAIVGVSINAWFLLPDTKYIKITQINDKNLNFEGTSSSVSYFNEPDVIFSIKRFGPLPPFQNGTPDLDVQIPFLVLIWALFVVFASRMKGWPRRLSIVLASVVTILTILILYAPTWNIMPTALKYIQYPYRLHSYIALVIAALVIAALVSLRKFNKSRRVILISILVAILSISLVQSVKQVWHVPTHIAGRDVGPQATASLVGTADTYRDKSLPEIALPEDPPQLRIDPAEIGHASSYQSQVVLPTATKDILTNIVTGPHLLSVEGVEVVGRTVDGFLIVRSEDGQRNTLLTIKTTNAWPLIVGRYISLLALIVAVGIVTLLTLRGRRRHRE